MASLVVVATGLGGCTSVMGPTPAPSCDSGARRPLNRSMWDWEGTRPVAPVASAITPAPSQALISAPAASGEPVVRKGEAVTPERVGAMRKWRLPGFDVAASLRPCTGEVGHG
jgi:type IV secretion system protein VirB7